MSARSLLEALFRAALTAVDPVALVRSAVGGGVRSSRQKDSSPFQGAPLRVLAAGKAAAAMASALEAQAGARIAAGLAVTKQGHGVPLRHIALLEAGHPVPDARSERAARMARALVEEGSSEEILVVLLSGGASALLACPLPGLSREDLEQTTRSLLEAGADIEELNVVRKHLTALAGGRLVRLSRAQHIELLAISDVPGDRLDLIGSGPCTPDPSRYVDALQVLERRIPRSAIPPAVFAYFEAGVRGEHPETPKPGHPSFLRVRARILASNRTALEAARAEAGRRGHRAVIVSGSLRGEAREAGRRLAALARAVRAPTLLLAGGETTVTLRGAGLGGRNQELALAAALEIAGSPGVALLAAGTDGSDGPTDAAGAYADGRTLERGRARGVEAARALARNDSYRFFEREGGLLRTGPTRTNVMDLTLVYATPFSIPS